MHYYYYHFPKEIQKKTFFCFEQKAPTQQVPSILLFERAGKCMDIYAVAINWAY